MIELALVVLPIAAAGLFAWWDRRRRRDLRWTGVTPGEQPLDHDPQTSAISTADANRVTVRFTPPDGMTPGMAGTIIDGSADRRDVAATLIDLAVRGYLVLHAERPTSTQGKAMKVRWRLTRTDQEATELERHEQILLDGIPQRAPGVLVNELPPNLLSRAQDALREDSVAHGWHAPHRALTPRRVAVGLVVGIVIAVGYGVAQMSPPAMALAIGLAVAAAGLAFLRTSSSRTAAGTAARVQARGFERYLATAKAHQIRLEEAQDLFSRFLPWAIAFGVADRWAKTFAEAAAYGHAAGVDAAFDLQWLDGLDLIGSVADVGGDVMHALDIDGIGALQTIGDLASNVDEAGSLLGDALGGITDGLGDLVGGLFDAF